MVRLAKVANKRLQQYGAQVNTVWEVYPIKLVVSVSRFRRFHVSSLRYLRFRGSTYMKRDYLLLQGIVDDMIRDLAACGATKEDPHICRNLHRLIQRKARQLQMVITPVQAPIRMSKRGRPLRWTLSKHPMLLPSSWASCIFNHFAGRFFLGGQSLDCADAFGEILRTFWQRYQEVHPELPFFGDNSNDWTRSIPVALHGDEGRGQGRKPILIVSLQPLITTPDMSTTNPARVPDLHT